jgi:hypothetical protein
MYGETCCYDYLTEKTKETPVNIVLTIWRSLLSLKKSLSSIGHNNLQQLKLIRRCLCGEVEGLVIASETW